MEARLEKEDGHDFGTLVITSCGLPMMLRPRVETFGDRVWWAFTLVIALILLGGVVMGLRQLF
jgi:hypothetical protein